jgi:AcrR family transcriptional regulator
MVERRATGRSAKRARRQQILDATADLLRDWSFADITMQRIADRSGVAKGTLYLYFRTKEALFLALFEEGLANWYSELEGLAERASGEVDAASAARAIVSTLSARTNLIHLHGLLYSTFGYNIDVESLRDFRQRHLGMISTLAPALSRRVAGLSVVSARRFLIRLEVVVGGLAWAAFPTASVARALGDDELTVFALDFEKELVQILSGLLTRETAREGV